MIGRPATQFTRRGSHWVLGIVLLWVCAPGFGVDAAAAGSGHPSATRQASAVAIRADTLLDHVLPPLSRQHLVRRWVAQATFCLPQNLLGAAYYALLRVTGKVTHTVSRQEILLVVTRTPFGASLGRYLFLGEAFLTESALRHEYGHTLQGYKRGPFYLLFEGVASFLQAALSMGFPSFAEGYYDRWPENEADILGGVEEADGR
jgi:hypothetical protein